MTKSNFSDCFTWLGCMKHGATGHISLNYAPSIFLRRHLCFRHLTWFLVKPCKPVVTYCGYIIFATNCHLFVGILLTLPSVFFIDPSLLNYLFVTCWAFTGKLTLKKFYYTLVGTIFWRNSEYRKEVPQFTSPKGNSEKELFGPLSEVRVLKKVKSALV